MQLGQSHSPTGKPHLGDSLQFPPRALPVDSAKANTVTDADAPRDEFNVRNFAENLEVHTTVVMPRFRIFSTRKTKHAGIASSDVG
jgi:hypothetical protein